METMGWGEGNEESRKIENSKQREREGGERETHSGRRNGGGRIIERTLLSLHM